MERIWSIFKYLERDRFPSLCQDKPPIVRTEWPHGTSGQYGEEMSLLQLQYISNDSYALIAQYLDIICPNLLA